MQEVSMRVCVTGGAGYLASYLIKHLLLRGYTVHATLRSLSDESKVRFLKKLDGGDTRLKVFEADIYKPHEFEAAIQGCQFVFHLATPLQNSPPPNSKYKSSSEATVDGVRCITEMCINSNSVKKLIYTASVMAASPLLPDGSDYRDAMDESCWTPLNLSYQTYPDYIESKTLGEQQVLSYNGKGGLQVVSLATGLVGGDTIQSHLSASMSVLLAQLMNDNLLYQGLRSLEELMSKVPIVHVHDVIQAHIFSMENSHLNGRFLCANAFLKTAEIATLIHKHHPHLIIPQQFIQDTKRQTKWGSTKLEDLGFVYKFDAHKIIDASIVCAKSLGSIG